VARSQNERNRNDPENPPNLSSRHARRIDRARRQDRVVNVYNWSDYIDEEPAGGSSTKETGIDLIYDVFDSNEVLETKLLAGGSGYDVVVPTGTFLQRQIKAGVFQKLDKSKLPNLDNMWDVISERTEKYDPGNEYAINYMWGTTGIGINVDKVKERAGRRRPDEHLGRWSSTRKHGKARRLRHHLLDAPTEMIPAALNYSAWIPTAKDQDVIAKAKDVCWRCALHPQVPLVGIHQRAGQWRHLRGRRLVGRHPAGARPRGRGRQRRRVEYIIPKEGALMWFDKMAIPSMRRMSRKRMCSSTTSWSRRTWRRRRTTSTTPTATSPPGIPRTRT
jgi:putrescine transport system substrate-binding protein